MATTRPDKNDSPVRQPLIYIGTDEAGRRYDLVTVSDPDEVVVRHGGEVVMTDALHELGPRHIVETVAAEIGWRECQWAEVDAKPVPRKYGGR